MATVHKPSSFAARKIRMAISLRLAASSLRMGFPFFITQASGPYAKLYIVTQQSSEAGDIFSMRRIQFPSDHRWCEAAFTVQSPRQGSGAVACDKAAPELAVSGVTGAVRNC